MSGDEANHHVKLVHQRVLRAMKIAIPESASKTADLAVKITNTSAQCKMVQKS